MTHHEVAEAVDVLQRAERHDLASKLVEARREVLLAAQEMEREGPGRMERGRFHNIADWSDRLKTAVGLL